MSEGDELVEEHEEIFHARWSGVKLHGLACYREKKGSRGALRHWTHSLTDRRGYEHGSQGGANDSVL